jgi:hypothetical protein
VTSNAGLHTAVEAGTISRRAGRPSLRPLTNRTSSPLRSSIGISAPLASVQSIEGDGAAT